MADVIKKSTNKFTKGLVMDFSPENTRNEVLTHALNATLLTFNGNELSLQNDMGNARVETAYLPEGYIPVGTCEYGGIIYIVSYNPLEDKSQIGCFPSPERNVSNEELGTADAKIQADYFQDTVNGILTGVIKNNAQYVLLKEDHLNPGDKFLTYADSTIYNEKLADLQKTENGHTSFIENPILALNIVSIEDSGKIVYLNSDLRQYSKTIGSGDGAVEYSYHILGEDVQGDGGFEHKAIDIDSYRNVVSSGYNVFRSKTSGRLALLAELIMIDSYSVTHSIRPTKDINGDVVVGSFDVLLHTEVSPNLTSANFATAPKLSYYHLKESQGYISHTPLNASSGVVTTPLFENEKLNTNFLRIPLTNIYTPSVDINLKGVVSDTGKFRFPFSNTYHGKMLDYTDDSMLDLSGVYTLVTAGNYHRLDKDQVLNSLDYFESQNISFYVYNPTQGEWSKVDPKKDVLIDDRDYYTKTEIDHFEDVQRNIQHRNEVLWEQKYNPILANNIIVGNSAIQKYQKIESYKHVEIAFVDIKDGMVIVKQDPNNPNKYDIVDNPQENSGVTYFERISMVVYNPVDQNTALQLEKEYQNLYYYPDEPEYVVVSEKVKEEYWAMESTGRYPYEEGAPWGYTKVLYRKWVEPQYNPATEEELRDYYRPNATPLYYKTNYVKVSDLNSVSADLQLFMVPYRDTYLPSDHFMPDALKNYILGKSKPSKVDEPNYSEDGIQYDVPISLHTLASLIPQKQEVGNEIQITQYEDLKLGTLKLPQVVADNELDLPFKYNYTVVPCMNYGRLDHLAVSNTVDFSQLHAFNHSNFNTWKYHIDDNQIRLTFGAEIFDTFEDFKVDGLILEFYDLWGFAGSLEINDKKSYSGVFTRLLSLSTPNALSKKLVVGNEYRDDYKHNIEICGNEGNYYLDDKQVTFNPTTGWNIQSDKNDCGVLYPNIIYGVKTYIRQTTADGSYKFTRKKDFFLYTLPIFNEFYYTTNDFSMIEDPTLDLILTYKLTDASKVQVINSDKIINGYSIASDYTPVSEYLEGHTDQQSINGTRYYKYVGKSELALEIGLKQEYQRYGLSYDVAINDLFGCTLQLSSAEDKNTTLTISSGDSASVLNLNYQADSGLSMTSNSLLFGEGINASSLTISSGNFGQYNFINRNNQNTIPIKYEFVVGYPFTISDIRNTEVPATTVCALFHRDAQGRYNLDDFGLHDTSEDPDTHIYLSKAMLLNSGTAWSEFFGVVSHNNWDKNASAEVQYKVEHEYTQSSEESHVAGKLNTGKPLSVIKQYIGKLTFCQPHAHAHPTETNYGINVYDTSSAPRLSGNNGGFCTDDCGTQYADYDDCYGIVPVPNSSDSPNMYEHPLYNLAINTQSSLEQGDMFISTMDYKTSSGYIYGYDINKHRTRTYGGPYTSRAFVGMDGEQLKTFYEKFVNTVQNIYAYNPDYDKLQLQQGTVSVNSNPVSFTSYITSQNAALTFPEGKSFNDYIYIGSTSLVTYYQMVQLHSGDDGIKIFKDVRDTTTINSQLNFKPNYTYLGDKDNVYLVTSLTYNTSAPSDLTEQLEIKTANKTCVKHADGSYTFLNGEPNKNVLYGFSSDVNKLVQLDVVNYTIDETGLLSLKPELEAGSGICGYAISETEFLNMMTSSHILEHKIVNSATGDSTLKLDVSINPSESHIIKTDPTTRTAYFATRQNTSITPVFYTCEAKALGDGYAYTDIGPTDNQASWYDVKSVILRIDISSASLRALDNEILSKIVSCSEESVSFDYITSSGENKSYSGPYSNLAASVRSYIDDNGSLDVSMSTLYRDKSVLTALTFNKVEFTFTRILSLGASSDDIIYVIPTQTYHDVIDHRYTVRAKYNSARFRGTSLVINDLLYKPYSEHRLFVKSTNYKYDSDAYRGIIYYRACDDGDSWGAHYNTYSNAKATSHNYSGYNHLFLYTGPCFTPDYL